MRNLCGTVLWKCFGTEVQIHLKFLTWSSTPIRDKALLTALTYVTACFDEPQLTSLKRNQGYVNPVAAEHKSTLNVHVRLTWLLDCDVNVEEDLNGVCEQCSPPVNDEHDDAAEKCTQQGQPHVVIFICWSPAYHKKDRGKM